MSNEETVTSVMRLLIGLTLLSVIIYQSDKIDKLQNTLNTKTQMYDSLHTDLQVCWQTYNDSCKK